MVVGDVSERMHLAVNERERDSGKRPGYIILGLSAFSAWHLEMARLCRPSLIPYFADGLPCSFQGIPIIVSADISLGAVAVAFEGVDEFLWQSRHRTPVCQAEAHMARYAREGGEW